jgi:hypothetical protein
MWRVGLLFAVWSAAGGVAWAQGEPDQAPIVPGGGTIGGTATSAPTTAPPPSQPAPVQATPVPEARDRTRARTVDRRGPLVLGGIELAHSEAFWRLDAFKPLPLQSAPHFHVGVIASYAHQRAEIPELAIEAYGFDIYPSVFYDWKLPIPTTSGDFVITAEGGLGVAFARIKLDQPFMPGKFETVWATALHLASAAQFRARAGYVLSLQYVGLAIPVGELHAPPQYNLQSDAAYVLAFLAGYQFR